MKYSGKFTKEISFPLGGIGTGSIGIGGDGRLVDWEIFNRPAKGSVHGYSHFAVRAIQGDKITAAVLSGDISKDYMGKYGKTKFSGYGFGPSSSTMCGFPHFGDVEFEGEFPMATLTFKDKVFPANVKITAFNPFIPLDDINSGIPAAFFEIEVENTSDNEALYQVALTVANPYDKSMNVSDLNGSIKTLHLMNKADAKESVKYGDLTVATDADTVYSQTYWYRGRWQDGIVSFWNEFSSKKDKRGRTRIVIFIFDRTEKLTKKYVPICRVVPSPTVHVPKWLLSKWLFHWTERFSQVQFSQQIKCSKNKTFFYIHFIPGTNYVKFVYH